MQTNKERHLVNTFWIVLGVLTAVPLYLVLVRSILNEGTEQNLASWGLWAILDLITVLSVIVEGGNWPIIALYTLGSFSLCVVLAFRKQFRWTWFESFIVLLVLGCLLAWYLKGPTLTTIAGTTAVGLATLPQLRDSFLKPDRKTVKIWFGFTLANFFSLLGAETWEIKEWLYPGVSTGLCIALVAVNVRKKRNGTPVMLKPVLVMEK